MSARRDELADGLTSIQERIRRACHAAGRSADDLTLIVVTKTWPADDVRLLAGLGATDVGENRDHEAAAKAQACQDLGLRWHFVGRVQSNKAASVARYTDVVHSVDRPGLVRALDSGAERAGRTLDVLVQVSLDPAPGSPEATSRGGAQPGDVRALCDGVAACTSLRLAGVMGVAPRPSEPGAGGVTGAAVLDAAAEAFATLAAVAADVRREHPAATWISAGMSGDLEAAVAAGATHLRVGTAVLGSRPPLR